MYYNQSNISGSAFCLLGGKKGGVCLKWGISLFKVGNVARKWIGFMVSHSSKGNCQKKSGTYMQEGKKSATISTNPFCLSCCLERPWDSGEVSDNVCWAAQADEDQESNQPDNKCLNVLTGMNYQRKWPFHLLENQHSWPSSLFDSTVYVIHCVGTPSHLHMYLHVWLLFWYIVKGVVLMKFIDCWLKWPLFPLDPARHRKSSPHCPQYGCFMFGYMRSP